MAKVQRALVASMLSIAAAAPVRVGGVIQTTGKHRIIGWNARRAIEAWAHRYNELSGSTMVELNFQEVEDESSTGIATAVTAMVDQLDVIIGPYTSGANEVLVNALENETKPIMVWGGASENIFEQETRAPNVFGFFTPAGEYMTSGLTQAIAQGAVSNVLFVGVEGDGPTSFSAAVCNGAMELVASSEGLTDLGHIIIPDNLEDDTVVRTSFDTQLAALGNPAAARAPSVLVACGHKNNMAQLVKMMHAGDITVTPGVVLATQVATPSFKALFQGDEEAALCGLMMPTQWVSLDSEITDPVSGLSSEGFNTLFAEWTGSTPTYHSASAVAAGVALENAISLAGGSFTGDIAPVTAQLQNLNIDTFYGKIQFAADGKLTGKPMYTLQNQLGGESLVVAPSAVAEAPMRFGGGGCPAPRAANVVRIGGVIQTTGKHRIIGWNALRAIEAWAHRFNERNTTSAQVELNFQEVEDESSTGIVTAVTAMVDDLDVIFAPYTSGASQALVAALANVNKPIMVWGGASESIFTQATRAPNAFGLFTPAGEYMTSGLTEAAAKGASNALFVSVEGATFAGAVCDGAIAHVALEGSGITNLGHIVIPDVEDNAVVKASFDTQLAALADSAAAGAPNVLVACGHKHNMVQVVKMMNAGDLAVTPQVTLATQVSAGSFKAQFTGDEEAALCGLMMPTQWASVDSDVKDTVSEMTSADFNSLFAAWTGSDPTYHSASAAAACVALENAISKAGGFNADIAPVTAQLKTLDIDTFYGKIKFADNGKLTGKPMYTLQNQLGGESVVVAPAASAEMAMSYPGSAACTEGTAAPPVDDDDDDDSEDDSAAAVHAKLFALTVGFASLFAF